MPLDPEIMILDIMICLIQESMCCQSIKEVVKENLTILSETHLSISPANKLKVINGFI